MKTKKRVQQENINELIKLQTENPNAKVICFVSESCNNGEHSYMSANFGKPKIEKLTLWSDCWIDDEDYIKDELSNNLCDENSALSQKEFEKLVEKEYEKIKWEDTIVIYIDEH